MKAICLPSAPKLADSALQDVAAAFCGDKIFKLVQQEPFKEILEAEEPFAGRLLVHALKRSAGDGILVECISCHKVFFYRQVKSVSGYCENTDCSYSYNQFDGRHLSSINWCRQIGKAIYD